MAAPYQLNGLAQEVKQLLQVCRPSLLFVQLIGSRPSITDGLHLRARYRLNANGCRPSIAGLAGGPTDDPLTVEFDLAGAIHLNYPGTLYITGGDPAVVYYLRTTLIDDVPFTPTWHPLTVRIQAPALSYPVPEYHSAMSSPAPLVYAIAGHTGTLDHQRVPVCGGGIVTVGATDSTLTTYWWG